MLNKLIRLVCILAIHLGTALTVYLVAMLIASPICCITLVILDFMNMKVPIHLLYFWLLGSLVAWLPMIISVEIKSHK